MLAACWAQLTDQRTYALRQSLWNRHGSGSTASAQRSNPKPRATHLRHDHGAHLERYAVGHLRHSPSHLNAAPRPGVWTAHGTGYADLTRRVEAAGLLNRRHDIPGRHRLRLPPPLRRRPVRRGSRPTTGGIRRASSEWGTQCDVAGPMPTRHGLGMGNHREPLGNDRAPHVVVDVGRRGLRAAHAVGASCWSATPTQGPSWPRTGAPVSRVAHPAAAAARRRRRSPRPRRCGCVRRYLARSWSASLGRTAAAAYAFEDGIRGRAA